MEQHLCDPAAPPPSMDNFNHEHDNLEAVCMPRRISITAMAIGNEDEVEGGDGAAKLNLPQLVAYAYILTCAGPFGLEPAVRSAGGMLTILGIILCPIFYVAPQVLIIGELTAMMPTNDGYVDWVTEAFGLGIGYGSSILTSIFNIFDLSVYAVLFSSYIVQNFAPEIKDTYLDWLVRVTPVIASYALCLTESSIMSKASSFLGIVTVLPFLIGFLASIPQIDPAKQWTIPPVERDWSVYFTAVTWCFTGWSSMGNIAEDVVSPRVYNMGLVITLIVDICAYVMPLIAALTQGVGDPWEDGSLGVLYGRIIPWIGPICSIACALSVFGMCANSMACYARALSSMAARGWVPRQFGMMRKGTNVPWVATTWFAITVCASVKLEMEFLMKLDMLIVCETLILIILSYVRLRSSRPNMKRPVRVWGNKFTALIPAFIVIFVMMTTVLINLFSDIYLVLGNIAIVGVAGVSYVLYLRNLRKQKEEAEAKTLFPATSDSAVQYTFNTSSPNASITAVDKSTSSLPNPITQTMTPSMVIPPLESPPQPPQDKPPKVIEINI